MVRKERLTKIINILSEMYPEEAIMDKTPQELEEVFYKLISTDKPITKRYLESKYDKKGHKRVDREASETEEL